MPGFCLHFSIVNPKKFYGICAEYLIGTFAAGSIGFFYQHRKDR